MTRGINDPAPVQDEQANNSGAVANEEIMEYLDQLSLLVRDINTRLSTLERYLLAPNAPINSTNPANQPNPTNIVNGL